MRVTCSVLDDFLANVVKEGSNSIFRRTIYVEKICDPMMEGERKSKIRFEIGIRASAVVDLASDGQYLLEAVESCGIDYEDQSKELTGSENYELAHKKLVDFCEKTNLSLCKGIVDF